MDELRARSTGKPRVVEEAQPDLTSSEVREYAHLINTLRANRDLALELTDPTTTAMYAVIRLSNQILSGLSIPIGGKENCELRLKGSLGMAPKLAQTLIDDDKFKQEFDGAYKASVLFQVRKFAASEQKTPREEKGTPGPTSFGTQLREVLTNLWD